MPEKVFVSIQFNNFGNVREDKQIKKNTQFIEWLVTAHSPTFKEEEVLDPGHEHILEVDKSMALWAQEKLDELALVNGFGWEQTEPCTCSCHKPGSDILHFDSCCRYTYRKYKNHVPTRWI